MLPSQGVCPPSCRGTRRCTIIWCSRPSSPIGRIPTYPKSKMNSFRDFSIVLAICEIFPRMIFVRLGIPSTGVSRSQRISMLVDVSIDPYLSESYELLDRTSFWSSIFVPKIAHFSFVVLLSEFCKLTTKIKMTDSNAAQFLVRQLSSKPLKLLRKTKMYSRQKMLSGGIFQALLSPFPYQSS